METTQRNKGRSGGSGFQRAESRWRGGGGFGGGRYNASGCMGGAPPPPLTERIAANREHNNGMLHMRESVKEWRERRE